ncbi:uncharacterized protein Dana_GF24698 [Drosophila ananassae]|uniref:Uncharacterized protein n=1 Tax=Drosophila ananassae TaxID=7217 RepID=B3M9N2_DROAN|nr:uncharacterized protein LOC6507329 [Drosophila ananassae]EDV39038.1 uncharacterized protein Dana_GF24698 [Drosophila ananassae]
MDFEYQYRMSQCNGTLKIETRNFLVRDLRACLESGEGELFLSHIPRKSDVNIPRRIVELASTLGDIYALRYKIDFSGICRGFAYLQYIDASRMKMAVKCLPKIFKAANLRIAVKKSNNTRELLLRQAQMFSPVQMYLEMQKVCQFSYLRVYEHRPREFLYVFGYINNDQAANAHQSIRAVIRMFGSHAHVAWLHPTSWMSEKNCRSRCCQKLDKNFNLPDPSKCNCFKF